jgi:hypothetical protein
MNDSLIDFIIDIELLDSTAARTELADYHMWAYGDHGYDFNEDGEPVLIGQVN